jgi:hypothetical protein
MNDTTIDIIVEELVVDINTNPVAIKGDTGVQGIQGIQGEQGIQGIQGEEGLSAYEVAVTNGFTGTEQEWVSNFFFEYFIIPLGFPTVSAQLKVDEKLLGEFFPFNFIIQNIVLTLTTAPTSSNFIVDIKKNDTSIFSTLLSVDADEKTSVTASTPYALNTTTVNEGDVLSFSVVQLGAVEKGEYPVLVIKGVRV